MHGITLDTTKRKEKKKNSGSRSISNEEDKYSGEMSQMVLNPATFTNQSTLFDRSISNLPSSHISHIN